MGDWDSSSGSVAWTNPLTLVSSSVIWRSLSTQTVPLWGSREVRL